MFYLCSVWSNRSSSIHWLKSAKKKRKKKTQILWPRLPPLAPPTLPSALWHERQVEENPQSREGFPGLGKSTSAYYPRHESAFVPQYFYWRRIARCAVVKYRAKRWSGHASRDKADKLGTLLHLTVPLSGNAISCCLSCLTLHLAPCTWQVITGPCGKVLENEPYER